MIFGEFIFLVTIKQSFGRYLYLIRSVIKLMNTQMINLTYLKIKKENNINSFLWL
jgi:hypothetical protein